MADRYLLIFQFSNGLSIYQKPQFNGKGKANSQKMAKPFFRVVRELRVRYFQQLGIDGKNHTIVTSPLAKKNSLLIISQLSSSVCTASNRFPGARFARR